jgi:hypothetical protein
LDKLYLSIADIYGCRLQIIFGESLQQFIDNCITQSQSIPFVEKMTSKYCLRKQGLACALPNG